MKRPWFRQQSVRPRGLCFIFLQCAHEGCARTFGAEGNRYVTPQERQQAAWEKGWSHKRDQDFCPEHAAPPK